MALLRQDLTGATIERSSGSPPGIDDDADHPVGNQREPPAITVQDAGMERRRRMHVDLDHLDRLDYDWLFVVLEAPSGMVYEIQTCGTSCVQSRVEGHLIPIEAPDAYAALIDLFVREFSGSGGPRMWAWTPAHLDSLRAAISTIRFPADYDSAPVMGYPGTPIHVDESRLSEATEAWIPVTTELGTGILVWSNSD
ncbi:DUF6210 family protein [Embleya sp. NPDC020886]|uniref:DUF6210 family protein n=1 Tax=Embleya sp. NPDC020886 TaxID=3363980 RepID=UPI0037965CE8